MIKGEVKKEKKKGKKPMYDNVADELIDELDQHEKEMNDMLKYLQETQDFLRSKEDLQSIEQMMEVTKDTMEQHFEAYNKFKDQIDTLNEQAEKAITSLNFYDDQPADTKSELSSAQSQRKSGSAGIRGLQGIKQQTALERVREDQSDESSDSGQTSDSSSSGSDEDSYARKINKPLKKKVS